MCIAMIPAFVFADEAPETFSGKIVVICTGNVNGDIDFYETVSAYKQYYESNGATVILADAGNYMYGSKYASFDRGNSVVSIMDTTGYDIVGMGKADFAYAGAQAGLYHPNIVEKFKSFAALFYSGEDFATGMKPIATTVTNESAAAYKYESSAAVSGVGFVSVTDPEAANVEYVDCNNKSTVAGLAFASGDAMYNAVNSAAGAFDEEPVICISNTDVDENKLTECDYVFEITGSAAAAKAVVIDADGKIETVSLTEGTADKDVVSAIETVKNNEDVKSAVTSDVDVKGSQESVRSAETAIGNLATDAIAWYAKQSGNPVNDFIKTNSIDYDNVIGLWNGGNLRAEIKQGDVTRVDIKDVIPFPNWVAVAKVNGAQLLEVLETGTQNIPGPAFPQVSGIKYTVKAYEAYDAGEAYGSDWYIAKSINRVEIESVNGKPFDPNATYAIVSSDKLLGGMDAYYMFKGNTEIYPGVIEKYSSMSGVATAAEAINQYVQNGLGGKITNKYAKTEGRITIIDKAPVEPDDAVPRIAGATRYDTATEAAKKFMELNKVNKLDTVIVACGSNYPDALTGSYLAKEKNAPIILVDAGTESKIASFIKDNLNENGQVYLLGGTGAVSARFEESIKTVAGNDNVKRLGGANRYDTNLMILNEAGVTKEDILVCAGNGYADSLSASATGLPIMLVGSALTQNQKDFIADIESENAYAVGGEAVVSKNVMSEIKSAGISNTDRIAGKNRYLTSVAVADRFFKGSKSVVLAYAQNFPDGLSGGPIAISIKAPLILVSNASSGDAKTWCNAQDCKKVVVMGGTTLISDKVAKSMIK